MSKRRGRGEGSIFQREDGQWVATLELGKDQNGKRRRLTVYGSTKKEAQDKLLEAQQRQCAGLLTEGEKVTVGAWLDTWLALRKRDVGGTTSDEYERHIRLHLKPALVNVKLRDLKPLHGELLLQKMSEAGSSPAMQAKAVGTLRSALKEATVQGVLRVVPPIKRPKGGRTRAGEEIQVWDRAEVKAFLAACQPDRLCAVYVLALDSGMRQGELFGLPWDALDWEKGTLSVRQSLLQRGDELALKEPKTAKSRRLLRLTPETLAALNEHRQRMVKEGHYQKDGLVFVDTKGGPLRKSNFQRNSFFKCLARAKVKKVRFHDLRHTAATSWLLGGINIKAVSARLGHAKVQITLDTYSHFLPEMDEQVVTLNRQLLFGS